MRGEQCKWTMWKDGRRVIATLAIALLLGAQLLALAHSHNVAGRPSLAPPAQTVAAQDICGLCILVLHAPLSPVSPPSIDQPHLALVPALAADTQTFASGSHSFFLTRAPPSPA